MQMLEKDPGARPTAREVERQLSASTGTILLGDVVMPSGGPARATVGRDAQRAQLLRAFARVKAGRSLFVGVSGEPGIGKTSLVEDFLADLAVRGEHPTIARGRCSERLAGSEAFLPVLEALDSLMRRTDGPSLHSIIKVVAPTWYLQIATDSTETTSIGEMRERTPAGSQERMKRELGALLQEVSRQRPLVLFIDDLHWADVSTIDLLNYLAGRLAELAGADRTNYRPSDMAIAKHPFLGVRSELQARGVFEELALRFLEVRDVERYLELQFPGHAFPPDFAAAIHAKTEGSPLFMADLLRYLRDTGGIVEESGRWVVARGAGRARPARVGQGHDRAQDRAARRPQPPAAARGQRAGARVRLRGRSRRRPRWIRRKSRSGWKRWSGCTCSSREATNTSFPTAR